MNTTVLQLITDALMALGVLDPVDPATPEQSALAVRVLNRLIGAYSTNRLLIFSITRTVFDLAAGTASYTVGTGGTISIPRPANMQSNGSNVTFIDTSQFPNNELPLVQLTDDAFQAITQKAYQGTYPTSWYYNPTYTQAAPYGTLTFWPVPNVSYLDGVIYAPRAVQQVVITDTIYLPPEWGRFLWSNLAIELEAFFPAAQAPQRVKDIASESKGDVERTNLRMEELTVDLALQPFAGSGENFYSGVRGA